MDIFLRILKETGIAIVVLVVVALVVWLLFHEQLPFLGQEIPDPIQYAGINKDAYDIEDEENPTQVYEATNEQLDGYVSERQWTTGMVNPFTTSVDTTNKNTNKNNKKDEENTNTDIPAERVTITNPTVLGSGDMISVDSGTKSLE